MKVWIDQDLCTGDGICEEICPDVFEGLEDGLFYVKDGDHIYSALKDNTEGADGLATVPSVLSFNAEYIWSPSLT